MSDTEHSALTDLTIHSISEDFSAADSDISFLSSDGILFKLHKKNLEVAAGAFPPTEFHSAADEVITLTEPSGTLEVLFQFIYPARHPKLEETIKFDLLDAVAEAAEKYEVYIAMDACKILMRNALPNHAAEIMLYAVKHNYTDIVDLAAIPLLDYPFEELMNTLPGDSIRPWAIYYQKWSVVHNKACIWHSTTPIPPGAARCPYETCVQLIKEMAATMSKLSSQEYLSRLPHNMEDSPGLPYGWRQYVESQTASVPKFSSFL